MRQFTHTNRITSIHGVLLPPKKKQVCKKYITFRFVVKGTIPSKKNMIWADTNLNMIMNKLKSFKIVMECLEWLKDNLKAFIRNSKKYLDWYDAQKEIVLKQAAIEMQRYKKHGLIYPLDNVTVKVYHYWNDNMDRDLTNKLDSLNDLFVACGIVSNDNWQVIGRIESDCELYKGEILEAITTIDITQRVY